MESALKFWLPKTFPERVRVIVTASPNSKSSKYMKALGCPVVPILAEKKIMRTWLENLEREEKSKMLVEPDHIKRLTELIDQKLSDENVKMIFVKSLMGMLAPKPYQGMEDEAKERELFRSYLGRLDWKKLKGTDP